MPTAPVVARPFGLQHVVDQDQGVAAAQLAHRPILQRDALDLHVDEATDPVLVGRVRPLGSRVALRPRREVRAQRVGSVRDPVRLVDRPLGVGLPGEGAVSPVPGRLGDVMLAISAAIPGNPYDLARRVAAAGGRLAPHTASSRCLARKSSTSAGSIRRDAPSL